MPISLPYGTNGQNTTSTEDKKTMTNPRKIEPYIRLLELQAVISEEWGETVKEINEYLWKGNSTESLERALKELRDIVSPMREMESLLETTLQKRKKTGQQVSLFQHKERLLDKTRLY